MWRKKLRVLVEGDARGELLVCSEPVSPLGEIDPLTGEIKTRSVRGSVSGKILVFPWSRGSTVGSYILYALKHYGKAPGAIIVVKADPIVATGCVISDIPLAEGIEEQDIEILKRYRNAAFTAKRGELVAW